MDFDIPAEIFAYLRELDEFIEREIRPLERENDNIRFFDHRREHARTDWDNDGQPRHEWEELLAEMKRRADKAGHLRFGLPKSWAARKAPTSPMPSSGSISRTRGWASTTTCRTRARSSAISRSRCCYTASAPRSRRRATSRACSRAPSGSASA